MKLELVFAILFILTITFMIREMYIKTKFKNSDYSKGYKDAVNEISAKWNELCNEVSYMDFYKLMLKYLQSKLNGGG